MIDVLPSLTTSIFYFRDELSSWVRKRLGRQLERLVSWQAALGFLNLAQ
jgi:hypothetical protein